jgi:hypothetical protein
MHTVIRQNAVLSGYITTLKNKQKLDVSSEGPSSRVSSSIDNPEDMSSGLSMVAGIGEKSTGFYTKSIT